MSALPGWDRLPETLRLATQQLKHVHVENRDALDVVQAHDGPETLHYVDPPYMPTTRTRTGRYSHEYAERQRDTVQSVRKCIATLTALGIADCDLWVDAPGMGLAVISDFNEAVWYPNEFFGNNPPEDRDRYINLAAECWNDAGLELVTGRVHIKSRQPDKTLFTQLTTRKKEFTDDSKIRNEKKDKMKARNLSSPDRADALLGAIWASIRGAAGVWTGAGNKPVVGKSKHAVRHTGRFRPI